METIPLDDVIRRYNEGQSPYQIAKHYETYPNRIRRMLEKANIAMRGKSEAQKLALKSGVSSHPTEGRKRTEEEKRKISGALCDYWENIPDDEREKRSETSKRIWNEIPPEERARMTKKGVQAIRTAAKYGSKAENAIRDGLLEAGYDVQSHNQNLIPLEKLEVDLYIPSLNAIIEVDGPSHFEPIRGEDVLQKQILFDEKKNGTLLSKGFAIIRVKALRNPSIARTHTLLETIKDILEGFKDEFPEEGKRFIEVEL